jgi:nitroimidazol reductase NimA-like FMN-containing flavoprotein (pyridoxamine 5'-phosphate oxidase superfamily)
MTSDNIDRQGLEILDQDTCWELIGSTPVGRLAFMDAGEPMIFPVMHAVDGRAVVFRTTFGTKLLAASMEMPVAFEVDGIDPVSRTGWSVVVRGTASEVIDPTEIEHLLGLGLEPWADAVDRDDWIRVRVLEISGRRIPG